MDFVKFIDAYKYAIIPAILDLTKDWGNEVYLYEITFAPVMYGGCSVKVVCTDNKNLIMKSKTVAVCARFDAHAVLEGFEVDGLKWELANTSDNSIRWRKTTDELPEIGQKCLCKIIRKDFYGQIEMNTRTLWYKEKRYMERTPEQCEIEPWTDLFSVYETNFVTYWIPVDEIDNETKTANN